MEKIITDVVTINKVVHIGTAMRVGSIFCNIKYNGRKLTVTGIEGPSDDGDCRGACGQIAENLKTIQMYKYAPGWNSDKMLKFARIWKRWHLNDLIAGNPTQEQFLRDYGHCSDYRATLVKLEASGLSPDPETSYVYGSAWFFEAVPNDVIEWLATLPDADKKPAWI